MNEYNKNMEKKTLVNRHHLLYIRKEWNKGEASRQLRSKSGLVFYMLREVHEELHEDDGLWGGVPLLERKSLEQIVNDYKRTESVMGNIAMLLTLASKIDDPNRDRFLEHVSRQMYYIKQGLIEVNAAGQTVVGGHPAVGGELYK